MLKNLVLGKNWLVESKPPLVGWPRLIVLVHLYKGRERRRVALDKVEVTELRDYLNEHLKLLEAEDD